MKRNRNLCRAFDCIAVAACVGIALGCGTIAALILALCGASAGLIVAVLLAFGAVGAWLGVKATRPARDLAAFG